MQFALKVCSAIDVKAGESKPQPAASLSPTLGGQIIADSTALVTKRAKNQ